MRKNIILIFGFVLLVPNLMFANNAGLFKIDDKKIEEEFNYLSFIENEIYSGNEKSITHYRSLYISEELNIEGSSGVLNNEPKITAKDTQRSMLIGAIAGPFSIVIDPLFFLCTIGGSQMAPVYNLATSYARDRTSCIGGGFLSVATISMLIFIPLY